MKCKAGGWWWALEVALGSGMSELRNGRWAVGVGSSRPFSTSLFYICMISFCSCCSQPVR